jgi:Bacterial PH domain
MPRWCYLKSRQPPEPQVGLLDGLLGNASEIDPAKIQGEFAKVLAAGERIEKVYQLIRDLFVFTDKRLILVDKQGLTGSKVEYHSLPYRAITHFSIETAGHFDLDADLKIWISGSPVPVQKKFNKRLSVYELQSVLATYVLGQA